MARRKTSFRVDPSHELFQARDVKCVTAFAILDSNQKIAVASLLDKTIACTNVAAASFIEAVRRNMDVAIEME